MISGDQPKKFIEKTIQLDETSMLFRHISILFYHAIELIYHAIELFYHAIELFYYAIELFFHTIELFFHTIVLIYHAIELFYHALELFFHAIELFFREKMQLNDKKTLIHERIIQLCREFFRLVTTTNPLIHVFNPIRDHAVCNRFERTEIIR